MALSESQRAELRAKLPPGGYDGSVASRAQIVLWHDEGYSVAEIAAMARTTKVTVYKWLDRYEEGGLAALENRKSAGRPREIPGAVRARILALTRQTPSRAWLPSAAAVRAVVDGATPSSLTASAAASLSAVIRALNRARGL